MTDTHNWWPETRQTILAIITVGLVMVGMQAWTLERTGNLYETKESAGLRYSFIVDRLDRIEKSLAELNAKLDK